MMSLNEKIVAVLNKDKEYAALAKKRAAQQKREAGRLYLSASSLELREKIREKMHFRLIAVSSRVRVEEQERIEYEAQIRADERARIERERVEWVQVTGYTRRKRKPQSEVNVVVPQSISPSRSLNINIAFA